jgi:hypothetical protein
LGIGFTPMTPSGILTRIAVVAVPSQPCGHAHDGLVGSGRLGSWLSGSRELSAVVALRHPSAAGEKKADHGFGPMFALNRIDAWRAMRLASLIRSGEPGGARERPARGCGRYAATAAGADVTVRDHVMD